MQFKQIVTEHLLYARHWGCIKRWVTHHSCSGAHKVLWRSQKLYTDYFYGDNTHCHGKGAPFEKRNSNETAQKIKYHVDYFLWQELQIQKPRRISKGLWKGHFETSVWEPTSNFFFFYLKTWSSDQYEQRLHEIMWCVIGEISRALYLEDRV